ncbi:MAG: zinc ribbon domain-containing protein [Clostridia bacterium]|nr:MAG: zinc ribbon domain-containing protein [Clostridia bacterium]
MPTYEYRCANCGVFEQQQPITAAPLKECPTCGAPVQRLISRNVGIIYKGSGFHTTDYRPTDYQSKAKEERGESSSAGDTSSATSSSTEKAGSTAS